MLHRSSQPPHEPGRLGWAPVLHRTLKEDQRFRRNPGQYVQSEEDSLDDDTYRRRRAEAELVHRLLGLLGYAAHERNIDLSGHEDLAREIRELNEELMTRHPS